MTEISLWRNSGQLLEAACSLPRRQMPHVVIIIIIIIVGRDRCQSNHTDKKVLGLIRVHWYLHLSLFVLLGFVDNRKPPVAYWVFS